MDGCLLTAMINEMVYIGMHHCYYVLNVLNY